MSERISEEEFNNYRDLFQQTCIQKYEEQGTFMECFEIDKDHILKIIETATEFDINCRGLKIYFGKKEFPSEEDIEREKFYSESDYNLLIVGVDEKGEPITLTGEIYDNLNVCPPDC